MSLAIAYSRAQLGIDAPLVSVEVHISNGLPGLSIVGLPEAEVREAKDRVRSALLNSQFEYPARRITINLAPADLPKEGARFDLAIAMGILAASAQVPPATLATYEFVGELALTGEIRRCRGVLTAALQARRCRRALFVPEPNAAEATLVTGARVLPAQHLLDVCAHLTGAATLTAHASTTPEPVQANLGDLRDVRGQQNAKRALEIAAAGGHNLLMIGPPGTGKSMLASRLPSILPPLDEDEALETAAVHSITHHGFAPEGWRVRPFRAPHHTASAAALVGGGGQPRPGEISLAHNGVLFLDELPEFERRVLEVLREPLESGSITISRAARQSVFPARFQLVAAMNPCPCGHLGDPDGACRCTSEQIGRYRSRLSGPLLDRIDIQVAVPRVPHSQLHATGNEEPEHSTAVRDRVTKAQQRQRKRSGSLNRALGNREIERFCPLDEPGRNLLERACERLGLSARAFHRVLRVARTIADLTDADRIDTMHLSEAISYRMLDRRPHY